MERKTSGRRTSPLHKGGGGDGSESVNDGRRMNDGTAMVGGSGGAVETVIRAVTPGAFVTTLALREAASTTLIVPRTADLGS